MIPSQPFIALVLAALGWLMLRLGVGVAVVSAHLAVVQGNAWAFLLLLPAITATVIGASATCTAAQALFGPGPAGRH